MSAPLHPVGLTLPSLFPDALFEALKNRIFARMPNPSPELANIAGGHNGVRYRLRACADYSAEFIECIGRAGHAPPPEDRYQQERKLFGFFVSGIAALDSFSFFIYFTAAHLRAARFPTQDLFRITRGSTAKTFIDEFPNDAITTALKSLIVYRDKKCVTCLGQHATKLKDWEDYRNILAHRAAPGRAFYHSFGVSSSDQAAHWRIDAAANIEIDVNLTPPRLQWLVSTLADLVVAANDFTQHYF